MRSPLPVRQLQLMRSLLLVRRQLIPSLPLIRRQRLMRNLPLVRRLRRQPMPLEGKEHLVSSELTATYRIRLLQI